MPIQTGEQTLVVRIERNKIVAGHDSEVPRNNKISLQISKPDEVRVAVTRLIPPIR
jgi:hypothetical protein